MGSGMFDGGISACLSDLVRFGSLYLSDGVSLLGEQVLPAAWVADTVVLHFARVRRGVGRAAVSPAPSYGRGLRKWLGAVPSQRLKAWVKLAVSAYPRWREISSTDRSC